MGSGHRKPLLHEGRSVRLNPVFLQLTIPVQSNPMTETQSIAVAQSPTVSVIMPAYNVEAFIVQALESACNQTISDIEIIVVDDGSEDNTARIVKAFDDHRISMIHKENGGCASARNAGIHVAKGNFISFLDADDYWLPNKLERELESFYRQPHVDLIFSLSFVINEEGKELGVLKSGTFRSFSFKDLFIENPVGNGSSVLIRKRALDQAGPFDESLPASSDCDMWLRIAKLRTDNFVCLPEPLTYYRRRHSQTTGDWARMQKSIAVVEAKARLVDPETVSKVVHLARCNKNRYLAFIAYEDGDIKNASFLLMKSFAAAPLTFSGKPLSWVLACALILKGFLPRKLHAALEASYGRVRRAFYEKRKG